MSSTSETRKQSFWHESWLGMVRQDGLVVSVPVLTAAGLMHARGAAGQRAYRAQLHPPLEASEPETQAKPKTKPKAKAKLELDAPPLELPSLDALLFGLMELTPGDLDRSAELPAALHVVAADAATSAMIRPSVALRRTPRPAQSDPFAEDDPFDDDPFADADEADPFAEADAEAEAEAEAEANPAPPAEPAPEPADTDPELSAAARVGRDYLALVWDLCDPDTGFGPDALGRPLDRPDREAEWNYPPAAKFERLLRHTRVPIGLLTNRRQVRLIYAPHGETTGSITWDLTDMGEVGGRPMLDAFLALLGRDRWLSQAQDRRLPALLEASRKQQAEVTERLADQVFDALQALLAGFEAAAQRDGNPHLHALVAQAQREAALDGSSGTGEVYAGLLTVLLRLVFMLYAEDRGLLPVEHPIYQAGYSLLGLFDELQQDQGAHPDAMDRRFGAWSRLVATWRAIYDGVHHRGPAPAPGQPSAEILRMPPRRGHLFDPNAYPFLEGRQRPVRARGQEPEPELDAEQRAAVQVPSVDDGTLYRVLDALLYLREGKARQRLSYRSLDVEQIGSVYEALMGYDVLRLEHPAVRLRARRAKGVWLSAPELLAVAPAQRAKWLKEEVGLDKAPGAKLAKAVAAGTKGLATDEQPEAVLELLQAHSGGKKHGQRAAAGRLVIQPGDERKRTSSHYTPRELTEPVVRRTLAPILRTMEAEMEGPLTSEALLNLKIVDPAMGSGAFLVEVVRQLGDHVVAAWQREGRYEDQGALFAAALGNLSPEARPSEGETDEADPVIAARRLVAQRCVYGVDKNPYAVNLAKLSLWLVTMSRSLPFTFVDHALRQGDSLVGLSLEQIRAFDWRVGVETGKGAGKKSKGKGKKKAAAQVEDPLLAHIVAQSLTQATQLRKRIVGLAKVDGEEAVLERELLLGQARAALGDARLAADLCVGAFFAEGKDKARLEARTRRLDLLTAWMGARERGEAEEVELRGQLGELRDRLLEGQAPFHWMLEFPEVFWEGRADPLAGGKKNRVAYFDAVVGNPPFMGGSQLSGSFGDGYRDWLLCLHRGSHGNADLCAHFYRRTEALLGPHGSFGLVGTNTIGQGDTRTTGLAAMVAQGTTLYDATLDLRWPAPGAAVTVSIVHGALGAVGGVLQQRMVHLVDPGTGQLSTRIVEYINSRLAPRPERADPVPLSPNDGLTFLGSKIYGQGFTLTPEQRDALVAKDKRNAERIKPYLGGAEVNRNPDQGFDRYVIDFGDMSLEEAERWPDLIDIVRRLVKPERDKNKREVRRKYWWKFGERAPALYAELAELSDCLVTSMVTKHLLFSSQPADRCYNHNLAVLLLADHSPQWTLSCRVHGAWSWAFSASLETRLNWRPTDCFQNYPFPSPDPRTQHPLLEPLGDRLDTLRSAFMLAHQVGLTITYNLLLGFNLDAITSDPKHKHHAPATDPRLAELRALHLELDRAVLDTYAARLAASEDPAEQALAPLFTSIEVPPYLDPRLPNLTPAQRRALETFNDAVLDALMALNEVRAAQEARAAKKN